MNQAAPTTATTGEEPSIEEILASIRKIISDEPPAEGEEAPQANADEGEELPDLPLPPAAAQVTTPESPANPEPTPVAALEAAPADDDILDLSAFAEEPDMAKKTKTAPESATESLTAPGHPMVERDQASDEANLAFDLGLEDSSNNETTAMDMSIKEIMASHDISPASEALVTADSLVSDTSASVATAAMAKLAQAADPMPTETQLWVGARTIEQVVEDLMRPMLKTWLDQNLPRLVERLVEKELARMARRATE